MLTPATVGCAGAQAIIDIGVLGLLTLDTIGFASLVLQSRFLVRAEKPPLAPAAEQTVIEVRILDSWGVIGA